MKSFLATTTRLAFVVAIVAIAAIVAVVDVADGFSIAAPRAAAVTSHRLTAPATPLKMSSNEENPMVAASRSIERGVSVDQDGKSNVWAIEPKMEVSSKSSDEQRGSLLVAGAGLAVVGALAAFVLLNLPDPDQF